jgi:hypothetical protein
LLLMVEGTSVEAFNYEEYILEKIYIEFELLYHPTLCIFEDGHKICMLDEGLRDYFESEEE